MRARIGGRLAAFLLGTLAFLALLEAALRLLGAAQHAGAQPPTRKPGAYVVLCLGDSFTFGTGAPREKSYPRQLEELLNEGAGRRSFQVVNGGVPGCNTAQILEDLEANLAAVRPDLVILLAGMDNSWNLKGFYAHRREKAWRTAVLDRMYRIRVFKLAVLLARDLRRMSAAASAGHDLRNPLAEAEAENRRRADPLVDECFSLRDQGAFLEAAELCRRAAALDPGDGRAYFGLGLSLKHAGRHREALRAFMRGVEADPGSPANPSYGELIGIRFSVADPEARREISGFFAKLKERRRGDPLPRQMLELVGDEDVRHEKDIAAWIAADLESIVALCRWRGVQVLMQSYPEGHGLMTREVARSSAVPFVDHTVALAPLIAEGRRGEYLVSDGHCNARGYGLMARNLRRKMAELGLLGPG
ncbi:MAG: hypothetical protein HY926_15880 [Elusimicrobia bacterium]|nr:hypothetical protein [Elusimicrobiota bacterium]